MATAEVLPDATELGRAAAWEAIPFNLRDKIEVIGIREGGLIDCMVLSEAVDHEEVPVKEEWAIALATQMERVAKKDGGTGQHAPITLGMVEGEPQLKIMDGFHRDAALRYNGQNRLFATIKHVDWNELYDFRIFTAKDHAHVRFSRVVQWIDDVWQHSGLAEKLSIEQAVLMTRFDLDGSKHGLLPDDVASAKEWVKRKEGQWDMAAMTIHRHLVVAAKVDPALVHSTREKKSGHALDAPTQSILSTFAQLIPDNYELQNLIMEIARQENLKGPEIRSLCLKVKGTQSTSEALDFIEGIDWSRWTPEYGETKTRSLRKAHDPRQQGGKVLDKPLLAVENIRQRLQQTLDRGEKVNDEMLENLYETEQRIGEMVQQLIGLQRDLGAVALLHAEVRSGDRPRILTTIRNDRPAANRGTSVVEPPAPKVAPSQSRPTPPVRPERDASVPLTEREQRFKTALLSYLNEETDEIPELSTRLELVQAERILLYERTHGDPHRKEDIREAMRVARDNKEFRYRR